MSLKLSDLTQVLQETTRRGIGSQRWQRPIYKDFLPPCNYTCPAGENIQAWLAHAQAGEYETAWRALVVDNPLPATHGRACYHPCESGCNRSDLDSPVQIHSVERFLGDMAEENGWTVPVPLPPSGKKVLVVGAGPAGLSCTWHLARMGHQVEIRDAAREPGGMMAHGIPAYRLPRDILDKEIARITQMPGVTLKCNSPVANIAAAKADGGFDAVFCGVGAQIGNHLDIPTTDGRKMIDGITLLDEVNHGARPNLGRVVVVGGGNVAMDAARTAKRLGAQEALVIYRKDQAHMKALPSEQDEAEIEGAKIRWLGVVDHFGADGIVVETVTMAADGSMVPTGETETLEADAVVLAVGQHSDLSLLSDLPDVQLTAQGAVGVDALLMTGEDGIFAGGDCIGGARTMTTATGHGKLAARAIDAWLAGGTFQRPAANPIVTFDMLHLSDFLDAPASVQPAAAAQDRHGFDEVEQGLSEKQARYEAQRCLSCGNCFECDNCYAACPEQAITRLGPGQGYAVSADLCTGCAACFEQCPCHAIEMEPEPTGTGLPTGSLEEPLAPSGFKVRP
jgi:formate dehydrogenase beta subunit